MDKPVARLTKDDERKRESVCTKENTLPISGIKELIPQTPQTIKRVMREYCKILCISTQQLE